MFSVGNSDTVISRLRHWSVTSPDSPAFVHTSGGGLREMLTRQQVYSLSRRCASWLHAHGVKKGDVITILLPAPSVEQLLVAFGAAVLGASALPAHPIMFRDGSDVIVMMNRGDVTAVVVDASDEVTMSILQKHLTVVTSEGDTRSVRCEAVPTVKTLINCRTKSFTTGPSFLTDLWQEKELDPCPCHPDDVVVILSTSGTSGMSKLVPKTHRQVLKIGQQVCSAISVVEGDTMCNSSSCAWISGYPSDYLVSGMTRIALCGNSSGDPLLTLWHVLCEEQPSTVILRPFEILSLLERHAELVQHGGMWRSRVLVTGSYPVKKEVCHAVGTLTTELCVLYGSTETGLIIGKSYTEGKQDFEDFNCGHSFSGLESKIVDDELREITEPGTRGQLLVKNDGIFTGYLKQPEQSRAVLLADGWYLTGDSAWRDDKGDYFVGGRLSDSFCVKELVVYPEMLEKQLEGHPAVLEVAVVALPDQQTVNRPCVCVIRKDRDETHPLTGEAVLRTYVKSFNQGLLKSDLAFRAAVPKWCIFLDQFPRSWTGKVKRGALRAQAMERLGVLL